MRYLLGVVLLGLLFPGCLGATSGSSACLRSDAPLVIETVAPEGYRNWDEDKLAIAVGDQVSFKATRDGCPTPDATIWHVTDARHFASWPDPPKETSQAFGGLETVRIESPGHRANITFPSVGEHFVWADFVYGDERIAHHGERVLFVRTYAVEKVDLPDDGSAHGFGFSAFCCPGSARLEVHATEERASDTRWTFTFSVEDTGEVVWRGQDTAGPQGRPWLEVLGRDWHERIRVTVEPEESMAPPPELRTSYRLDAVIGPYTDHLEGF